MSYALKLRNVSYRYPNAEEWSLQNVNLQVEKGKFIAVMGANGAGKTTLCHCLNGLIPQLTEGELKGQIIACGYDTASFRVQTLAKHVGIVMQDPEAQIFSQTVWEDAAFGPSNFVYPLEEIEERVARALQLVRLSGLENRNTAKLSGGQKQRLALAGVLAQMPELLVLDEPAAELDPQGRQELYAALDTLRKQQELTVIVAEHSPKDIVDRADEVIVLSRGEVAWRGAPYELFRNDVLVKSLGLRPLYGENNKVECKQQDILVSKELLDKAYRSPSENSKKSPVIDFKNVEFAYMPAYLALRGINLAIFPGEFVALVGANGAGKTTLAKHLNGLLTPLSGEVFVDGKNIKEQAVEQIARKVGYLFQNPDHQIFAASVEAEISYGLKAHGLKENEVAERLEAALNFTGLGEVRKSHPFTLSRGDRQLLAVASIVALKPKILVVDEPTSGLDWVCAQKLMELIRQLNELGTTVIMVSHDMDLVAQYANRVVVIDNGQISQDGSSKDVLSQDQSLLGTETKWQDKAAINEKDVTHVAVDGKVAPKTKGSNDGVNKGIMHTLDVRFKVMIFSTLLILCISNSPFNYIGITVGISVLALNLWAGVQYSRLSQILKPLIPVFILVLIGNGIAYLPPHHLAVSTEGILHGLTYVLKTLLIILTTTFFTTTTSVEEIIQLLQKLRVPPVVAFTVTTVLRFIPALDQKRVLILEAQRARGAKLVDKGMLGAVRAYIPIMVPLLIYSIVLANFLAMAMLNRGFGFKREVTLLPRRGA